MTSSSCEAAPSTLVDLASAIAPGVRALEVVAAAFETMCDAGRADGVRLVAASAFRDVARQTAIWDRKMKAARDGGATDAEALASVLEYSAPPGWSRHHWGTDIDLVTTALAASPRLEPEDWEEGGVCHDAAAWLERHGDTYGFVRPYDEDRGGFRPEPWHWSYGPSSIPLLARMNPEGQRTWLESAPYEGSELVLEDFEELWVRYVLGVSPRLRGGGAST